MKFNPLKRSYLLLEDYFNISFGSWNPLYNLGTLTFFFFWIILISGLYLFLPFHGSLDGAYQSVEYMTHEQWYVAGIMRSLHRYASDAAIITILLHMFREYALGRHKGFRWYSWFTGVPLLWFVITVGITGYWLVWDMLAQYIAVGSAKLMDALPIFFGSMSSNFLEGEMTDRFFTLIGFLHLLGQPLLLVFALWFHVRRLSDVNIMPPRGLAIGSMIALLALSLIKPVVSHEPADLTSVPQILNIDWYYLNVYPLLDYWTAGQVWMLTTGVTIFLMLLPWIPFRKADAAAKVKLSRCNGCAQCFDDCPFEAISVQRRTDGMNYDFEVVVDESLCAACGICVGSCHQSNPFRTTPAILDSAIDMPDYPVDKIRSSVISAIDSLQGDIKILLVGCDHGFDVKELKKLDTAAVSLYCSGMMPATMVEYALKKGADGIMMVGCRDNDCFYRFGHDWMEKRLAGERKPILRARADRRRIKLHGGAETDHRSIARALDQFRVNLEAIQDEPKAAPSMQAETDEARV